MGHIFVRFEPYVATNNSGGQNRPCHLNGVPSVHSLKLNLFLCDFRQL